MEEEKNADKVVGPDLLGDIVTDDATTEVSTEVIDILPMKETGGEDSIGGGDRK